MPVTAAPSRSPGVGGWFSGLSLGSCEPADDILTSELGGKALWADFTGWGTPRSTTVFFSRLL